MPLTTSTPLQGDRPSLRITGNTGSRQSEATRRPGAATPIAASERPPSLPSPEGSDRSGAPLRRLPLNRPRPAEELARPPLAASPPSRPKPWSWINRLRPAPPRGQLASTPWDKGDFMPFSEPLNQKFHQEFGFFLLVDFDCKPLSAIATSLMAHTVTIYPHLVHMPLKSPHKPILAVFSGASS